MQGVALWNMSTLTPTMSFHNAALARMIQSVGLPFMFVPITAVAYVGLKPNENNQASALMNVVAQSGRHARHLLRPRPCWRAGPRCISPIWSKTLNPLNPNYPGRRIPAHGLMDAGASAARRQERGRCSIAPWAAGGDAVLYRRLPCDDDCVDLPLPLVFVMQKGQGHGSAKMEGGG